MKVILLHNVKKIGKKGEVVEVADGYANGFILPKRLGKPATPDAIKQLKNEQNQVVKATESEKKSDKKLYETISGKEVTLRVQANDKGHLFASIGPKDIAAVIQNKFGALIDPSSIITEPIKDIDNYVVPIEIGKNKGTLLVKVEKK